MSGMKNLYQDHYDLGKKLGMSDQDADEHALNSVHETATAQQFFSPETTNDLVGSERDELHSWLDNLEANHGT